MEKNVYFKKNKYTDINLQKRHLNNFIIWHLWLSILFIFGQGFHYVLFLEYISVDADDQDRDSSVDSN
jgi:hypothetical protein